MERKLLNVVKFVIVLAGAVVGVSAGINHLKRKKVFISFAIEDKKIRDLLVGQSRNENSPFEFTDMSVKKPWDNSWKTQCKERIKSCHGVIVLLSKNTLNADGVHWEIKCAKELGLPIKSIYAYKEAKGCRLPTELKGQHIYRWSWPNINKFVDQLN